MKKRRTAVAGLPWNVLAVALVVAVSGCTLTSDSPSKGRRRAKINPVVDRIKMVCARQRWDPVCDIPEYTDDGRLTDSVGTTFGPYVKAFPDPTLGERNAPAQFAQIGSAVAIVYVDEAGPQMPGSYRNLKLSPGPNCLYLKYTEPDWIAYVTQASPTNTPCEPIPTGSPDPGPTVPVTAVSYTDFPGAANIPAVVRFHEGTRVNEVVRQPMIGVKCADKWCLIGPPASSALADPHQGVHPDRVRWAHRGWGDSQQLAVMSSGGEMQLGHVRASVLPAAAAEFNDSTQFAAGTWYHAATVYFPSAPGNTKYKNDWAFRQGENEIFVRHVAPGSWEGRIRNHNGILCSIFKCWRTLGVVREVHRNSPIPASARFQWLDDDEGIWVRCADGCCTVSAD